MMRKTGILFLLIVALLSGCGKKPLVEVIDLSQVGPQSQQQLSSAPGVSITPGSEPVVAQTTGSRQYTSFAITNSNKSNTYDERVNAVIFDCLLETTTFFSPKNENAALIINQDLLQDAAIDTNAAEDVLQAAELSVEQRLNQSHQENESFYEYSYYANQTITRLDGAVFSVVTHINRYAGETHPINSKRACNYSIETGERLSLQDILLEDGEEHLPEFVEQWIRSKTQYSIRSALRAVEERFGSNVSGKQDSSWYLTNECLILIFDSQDLSEESSGIVEIEVPLSELQGIVKEIYIPAISHQPENGNLVVYYCTDIPDAQQPAPTLQLGGNAFRLCLSGSDPVYKLRLSTVSQIGGQSLNREVLYCANMFSLGDQIIIELGSRLELTQLCLELDPGDGVNRKIYFDDTMEPGVYTYNFD